MPTAFPKFLRGDICYSAGDRVNLIQMFSAFQILSLS